MSDNESSLEPAVVSDEDEIKPYFDEHGDLVIPFECTDNAVKYWKQDGQKMSAILREIGVDEETWSRFTWEQYGPEAGETPSE